jgi:hypothetical protein
MFQWIQSLSWVVSIINGIKKLFGKADCAVAAEPPAAAPTTTAATPKKPRRRKPAKPKQQ